MKVKIIREGKWSIEFKAVPLIVGKTMEVSNAIGTRMIETKYASEVSVGRPKKETLVEETKVIVPEENKAEEPKKKRIYAKKIKK